MSGNHWRRADYHSICDCGKRSYATRNDARAARRRTGSSGLSTYRCKASGHWHIGHSPIPLKHGVITRDDVHAPRITKDGAA